MDYAFDIGPVTAWIVNADVFEGLAKLKDESIHCVVTSPPYWGLRDYGTGTAQIGQEPTLQKHIEKLVSVFREVRRVLRKDGTLWLNYGDAYAGTGKSGGGKDGERRGVDGYGATARQGRGTWQPPDAQFKQKDLMLIPARLAIALQEDGWYVRSEIIWHKPNPMPESVRDRPTNAHEKLYLLTKSERYFYDADAVRESAVAGYKGSSFTVGKTLQAREALASVGRKQRERTEAVDGRNLRNVWTIATQPYKGAHFATFPKKLVEPCIKAGCQVDGTVLDPFAGSGTVLEVASSLNRNSVGIEINRKYCALIYERLEKLENIEQAA